MRRTSLLFLSYVSDDTDPDDEIEVLLRFPRGVSEGRSKDEWRSRFSKERVFGLGDLELFVEIVETESDDVTEADLVCLKASGLLETLSLRHVSSAIFASCSSAIPFL